VCREFFDDAINFFGERLCGNSICSRGVFGKEEHATTWGLKCGCFFFRKDLIGLHSKKVHESVFEEKLARSERLAMDGMKEGEFGF
jgi:hypothetical protein